MIPFNKPYLTVKELDYIADAHSRGQLAGDGFYTKRCNTWLEETTGCLKALLTHSCTGALEMAAILTDIQPGDEVIMPSYTFVSTANAFALRGGIPVFVEIREDTLNLDEEKIEAAITQRTKVIVAVHYGGVGCEMDMIMSISRKYRLLVVEDSAQAIMATYKGRNLGVIGDIGCFSFHETMNIVSGEGGAVLINNPTLTSRAEVIREKGTNRSRFFRGEIDKYSWIDIGSSYLPGELTAAFLYAQLEAAEYITKTRLLIWQRYSDALRRYEQDGSICRRRIPKQCGHNGHIFELLLKDLDSRSAFIKHMKLKDVNCVFHYVPLHTSVIGQNIGRTQGNLTVTEKSVIL